MVPVVSASGGVGRSTLAALIAAGLSRHSAGTPRDARGVAVLDCAARGATPWPSWVTTPAAAGTGALAGYHGFTAGGSGLDAAVDAASSTLRLDGAPPVGVVTDTGPPSPAFLGGDPGPRWWLAVLPRLRAAVVDGDALEGARLAAQAVGGPLASIAAWFATPFVNTAVVLVTDTAETSLDRTAEALERTIELRLPPDRIVIVANERDPGRRRGKRLLPTFWREHFDPLASALVEVGHDRTAAEHGGLPALDAATLDRPAHRTLIQAVVNAAGLPWLAPGETVDDPSARSGSGPLNELLLRQAGRAASG